MIPLVALAGRISGAGATRTAAAGAGASKLSAKVFNFDDEKAKRAIPANIQPAIQMQQPQIAAESEQVSTQAQISSTAISDSGSIDGENGILRAVLAKLTSIESISSKILDIISMSSQADATNREKKAIHNSSRVSSFMPNMAMPQISETSKNNMILTALAAVGPFLVGKAMELVDVVGEQIDNVKEYYNSVVDSVSMFMTDTVEFGKETIQKIVDFGSDILSFGGGLLEKAQLSMTNLIESMVKKTKQIAKSIANLPIVKQIVEGFSALFDWLDKIIPEPVKKAMGWVKSKGEKITIDTIDAVKSTTDKILDKPRSTASDAMGKLFGGDSYDPNEPTPKKQSATKVPSGISSTADIPAEGRALLDTIASKESGGKYDIIVGGKTFSDFSKHPEQVGYTYANGAVSTAAGRYQITKTTNKALEERFPELKGFSPEIQDKKAWILAQERYKRETGGDLTEALKEGNVQEVGRSLSKEWTSLSGGIQATHSDSGFVRDYEQSLMGQKANELSNSSKQLAASQNKQPTINVQVPPSQTNMSAASKSGEGSMSFIPSPDAGFDPTLSVLKSSAMFGMA